jgi:hypothetical protein
MASGNFHGMERVILPIDRENLKDIQNYCRRQTIKNLARTPKPKTPRSSKVGYRDSVGCKTRSTWKPSATTPTGEGATIKLRRTWWFLRRWRGRPCYGCGCWPWEPARPSRRPFPALSVSISRLPPKNRGSCAGSQPWPPEWQSAIRVPPAYRERERERERERMRAAGSRSL